MITNFKKTNPIWRFGFSFALTLVCFMQTSSEAADGLLCTSPAGCGESCGEGCLNTSGTSWMSNLLSHSCCADQKVTLGRRIWVGGRWDHRDGSDATDSVSTPLDGDLDGMAFGWRTRNVDELFVSVEGVIMDGEFNLTNGNQTDYDEWQIETLFGYTMANDCHDIFITPYTGFRYRNAENTVPLGVPGGTPGPTLFVEQNVWNAPFGIRGDMLVTDNLALGVDARMMWKIQDEQNIVPPSPFTTTDDSEDLVTWRLDFPITYRVCCHAEIEFRPYYEWDKFRSDSVNRRTDIDEYGAQVSVIYRY